MLNILKNVSRRWISTNPAIIRNCVDMVNNLPNVITSQRAFISIDKTKGTNVGVGIDEEVSHPVSAAPQDIYLWIDVDCFECQLWSLLHPELQNGPLVVTGPKPKQHIFSIDYAARSCGVTKKDTVESARLKCPNLIVFATKDTEKTEHSRMQEKICMSIENFIAEFFDWVGVGTKHYEEFILNIGEEVDRILSTQNGFTKFADNPWTEKTKWILKGDNHVTIYNEEEDLKRLQIAANISAEILRRVQLDTGIYASGSIACSSDIAELAYRLNKPRGITVVTNNGLEQFFSMIKVVDTPGFKGKNGEHMIRDLKKPDGSRIETLHDFYFSNLSREEIIKILKSFS